MRPARLAGMTGIGVDRMGDLADKAGGAHVLRLDPLRPSAAGRERAARLPLRAAAR